MIRILFLLIVALCSSFQTRGQQNPSPKVRAYVEKARKAVSGHEPEKALKWYRAASQEDPGNYETQAQIAILLNRLGRVDEAIQALEDLLVIDSLREPFASLQLGKLWMGKQEYGRAIPQFRRLLNMPSAPGEVRQMAESLERTSRFRLEALAHPVQFNPVPLPGEINSSDGEEWNPSFSADGKTMVFTRMVKMDRQEDFYISHLQNGHWSEGEPIRELNTSGNEGAHVLSRDGRTLIFTACNRKDGFGSCDLYISEWRDDHWSTPTNLGPAVNSPSWDAQPALSPDERWLIFSSDRPGGSGGRDLWSSHRASDGHWLPAKPLEGHTSTSGQEETPFLHADGQTLYFSSDGQPGMGSFDLFVSRLAENGEWDEPVNLGYPINTEGEERALSLGMDGRSAFFSTDRLDSSGMHNVDIVSFRLPDPVQGKPVTFVQGVVRAAEGRKPLAARLVFQDLEHRDTRPDTVLASEDGHYLICLPTGGRYALIIDHPGMVFYSESLDLQQAEAFHPYQWDIDLLPVAVATSDPSAHAIVLRNILFASGRSDLLSDSRFELERIAGFLRDNPGIRIRIDGHTDDVGSPEDNQVLSESRAEAVLDWLVATGISPDRMSARGWGETRPLKPNSSEEDRLMNRRTELVILP